MAFYSATVTGAKVAATLTDFPAYVDLSSLSLSSAQAASIRVYSDAAKTTELAREVVSTTQLHVLIPSLTTTTVIYLDIDGSSADYAVDDTYGRNAVWADYVFVGHMEEASGDLVNSTGKGDLADSGTPDYQQTGKIGYGINLVAASAEYFSGTPTGANTTEPVTMQAIVAPDLLANQSPIGLWGSTTQYQMGVILDNDDAPRGTPGAYAYTAEANSSEALDGTLQLVHAVFSADAARAIYINGVSKGTNTTSKVVLSTTTLSVGKRYDDQYFDGIVDEARLINATLTADWLTTENNCLMDNTNFWTLAAYTAGAVARQNFLTLLGVS